MTSFLVSDISERPRPLPVADLGVTPQPPPGRYRGASTWAVRAGM